jgi:hypothetical protein
MTKLSPISYKQQFLELRDKWTKPGILQDLPLKVGNQEIFAISGRGPKDIGHLLKYGTIPGAQIPDLNKQLSDLYKTPVRNNDFYFINFPEVMGDHQIFQEILNRVNYYALRSSVLNEIMPWIEKNFTGGLKADRTIQNKLELWLTAIKKPGTRTTLLDRDPNIPKTLKNPENVSKISNKFDQIVKKSQGKGFLVLLSNRLKNLSPDLDPEYINEKYILSNLVMRAQVPEMGLPIEYVEGIIDLRLLRILEKKALTEQ